MLSLEDFKQSETDQSKSSVLAVVGLACPNFELGITSYLTRRSSVSHINTREASATVAKRAGLAGLKHTAYRSAIWPCTAMRGWKRGLEDASISQMSHLLVPATKTDDPGRESSARNAGGFSLA